MAGLEGDKGTAAQTEDVHSVAAPPDTTGPIDLEQCVRRTAAVAQYCLDLVRLLHAVDVFPQGGVTGGYYALSAALRYERFWLPWLASVQEQPRFQNSKPPLDVAFAWLVHRLDPRAYAADLSAKYGKPVHPMGPQQAFGFGQEKPERDAWEKSSGGNPAWPPPSAGSTSDTVMFESDARTPHVAARLAGEMNRVVGMLHSLLRPCYSEKPFLLQAQRRYAQFMVLHARHPGAVLVPTADIALMWHTHMALSGAYASACRDLLAEAEPSSLWRPCYLVLPPEQWWAGYLATKGLFESTYGQLYDPEPCRWVALSTPHPLSLPACPLAALAAAIDRIEAPPKALERARHVAEWLHGADAKIIDAPACPRSGGHVLYITWMLAEEMRRYGAMRAPRPFAVATAAPPPPPPVGVAAGLPASAFAESAKLAKTAPEAPVDAAMCCGCFGPPEAPTKSSAMAAATKGGQGGGNKKTMAKMERVAVSNAASWGAKQIVELLQFQGLPDRDDHPYWEAVLPSRSRNSYNRNPIMGNGNGALTPGDEGGGAGPAANLPFRRQPHAAGDPHDDVSVYECFYHWYTEHTAAGGDDHTSVATRDHHHHAAPGRTSTNGGQTLVAGHSRTSSMAGNEHHMPAAAGASPLAPPPCSDDGAEEGDAAANEVTPAAADGGDHAHEGDHPHGDAHTDAGTAHHDDDFPEGCCLRPPPADEECDMDGTPGTYLPPALPASLATAGCLIWSGGSSGVTDTTSSAAATPPSSTGQGGPLAGYSYGDVGRYCASLAGIDDALTPGALGKLSRVSAGGHAGASPACENMGEAIRRKSFTVALKESFEECMTEREEQLADANMVLLTRLAAAAAAGGMRGGERGLGLRSGSMRATNSMTSMRSDGQGGLISKYSFNMIDGLITNLKYARNSLGRMSGSMRGLARRLSIGSRRGSMAGSVAGSVAASQAGGSVAGSVAGDDDDDDDDDDKPGAQRSLMRRGARAL